MSDKTVKAVITARSVGWGSNCSNAVNGSHFGGRVDCVVPRPSRAPLILFTRATGSIPSDDGTSSSKTNMAVRCTCRVCSFGLVPGPDRRSEAESKQSHHGTPSGSAAGHNGDGCAFISREHG